MLDKAQRGKKLSSQDRQLPNTTQELVNRYDLDNTEVYDYLDKVADSINKNSERIDNEGVPKGGTVGQILAKNSNDDFDTAWKDNIKVIDNLTSTSSSDALSAKQGKILNERTIEKSISNVNYNDFDTYGCYYMGTGCTNAPANSSWVKLLVLGADGSNDIVQIAIKVDSEPRTYVRSKVNGTWNEWKRVIIGGQSVTSTYNKGSWNQPTKGLLTQTIDDSGAQHSVIVGQRADNSARLYGMDLLDNYTSPQMRLYVGSDYLGLSSAGVSHNGTYLQKVPTALYNNNSGSNGTITLSSSANNYNYIEIFFYNSGYNYYNSVKVYSPNNKAVNLITTHVFSKSGTVMMRTRRIKISGTSISSFAGDADDYGMWSSWDNSISQTNQIYITRVIGYL